MTNPRNITSLLGKLRYSGELELGDTIETLANSTRDLGDVANIVEQRIAKGTFIRPLPLAILLSKYPSPSLYEKVKVQLSKDTWSNIVLYRAGYPDSDIEQSLCDELYSIASDAGNPRCGYIVEAMGEAGSENALPTLEAIFFDIKRSTDIRELFSNSLGLVGKTELDSGVSFLKKVSLAIDGIRMRALIESEDPKLFRVGVAEISSGEHADYTDKALELAEIYLEIDPGLALNQIRMGGELIGKRHLVRLGKEKQEKVSLLMLDEIVKRIGKEDKPALLRGLRIIGDVSNFREFFES